MAVTWQKSEILVGAEDMAQGVKCLLQKYQDVSSDLQNSHKEVRYGDTQKSRMEAEKTSGSWASQASQSYRWDFVLGEEEKEAKGDSESKSLRERGGAKQPLL